MIKTQFDIPEVIKFYNEQKNYEILELNKHGDCCVIYFSSHGIYYPNEFNVFYEKIISGNRFEWKNNILTSARKVIFLRDVLKQWYLQGVNANLNSIEKLYSFLQEHTEGLRIICVGNSAGGYAAALFGSLLGATHVFNFSGQFSLYHILQSEISRLQNPLLSIFDKSSDLNKYFSLVDLVVKSNVPIFYFYPSKSNDDVEQSKHIAKLKNVYQYAFSTTNHGCTCYAINFVDLFKMSTEDLIILNERYKSKMIKPINFSFDVSGYRQTFKYIAKRLVKRLLHRTGLIFRG